MRVNVERWLKEKEFFWRRIREDLEIGYVDRELLPLLITINRDAELYTTSSCSGRIVVMDSETPWQRDETGTIFKSHIPVTPDEIDFVYRLKPYSNVWIVVTGPILHVSSLKLKRAVELLANAREVGFKHSGVLHVSVSKGVFVELVTGIYIAQLVRTGSRVLIPREELETLVEALNSALIEGKKRLQKLYVKLASYLPKYLDEKVDGEARTIYRAIVGKTPLDIFKDLCREKGIPCSV